MLSSAKNESVEDLCAEIEQLSEKSAIYVGCDSICLNKNSTNKFIVAVVMHYDCKHGAGVRCLSFRENRYMSIQERLYKEIELAVTVIQKLLPAIGSRRHELHFDINPDPQHISFALLSTAIGWGNAISVPVKVKPDAFAASAVADHTLRKSSVAA
jgi:predicted RNase H-related nuclease YkuK (DUF458 family)